MDPIEDALRDAFFPETFGGDEVSSNLREILSHRVKRCGLGISYHWMSAERAYHTSKEASEVLVGSLLGCTDLNYVAHRGCICRAISDRQKQRELSYKAVILI